MPLTESTRTSALYASGAGARLREVRQPRPRAASRTPTATNIAGGGANIVGPEQVAGGYEQVSGFLERQDAAIGARFLPGDRRRLATLTAQRVHCAHPTFTTSLRPRPRRRPSRSTQERSRASGSSLSGRAISMCCAGAGALPHCGSGRQIKVTVCGSAASLRTATALSRKASVDRERSSTVDCETGRQLY